jgi:general secretion pathway protein G
MQNRKRRNNGREGFTLLEVMLVLLILMTLATVGMFAVSNVRARMKADLARTRLGEFARLLDLYEGFVGSFPSTEEGLFALCECPSTVDETVWEKVATWSKLPLDPWDVEFNYQYPGSKGGDSFDLWSNGPDKISGTDDDIWFQR